MPTCRVLCSLSRKFCTRAGRGLPQQRASAASSAYKRCHRCRIHDFFRICRQGSNSRCEGWTPPLGADARSIEPRQHHVQGRRFRPPRRDSANVIAASTNKAVQNRAEDRNVGMHKAALTRRRPCRGEGFPVPLPRVFGGAREEARDQSDLCSCRSAASFNRRRRSAWIRNPCPPSARAPCPSVHARSALFPIGHRDRSEAR